MKLAGLFRKERAKRSRPCAGGKLTWQTMGGKSPSVGPEKLAGLFHVLNARIGGMKEMTIASYLILLLVAFVAYVGGYFTLCKTTSVSIVDDFYIVRWYESEWLVRLYEPATIAEGWVSGYCVFTMHNEGYQFPTKSRGSTGLPQETKTQRAAIVPPKLANRHSHGPWLE